MAHVYSEPVAEEIVAKVHPFLEEASFLYEQLDREVGGFMTTLAQSNLAERLHVSEREWLLVAEILSTHIPGLAVWVFGSRATGLHVKRFSDLDLAVAGRLNSTERAALVEAFDEALINFNVDVVELGLLDDAFRQHIEQDFVLLQDASAAQARRA